MISRNISSYLQAATANVLRSLSAARYEGTENYRSLVI